MEVLAPAGGAQPGRVEEHASQRIRALVVEDSVVDQVLLRGMLSDTPHFQVEFTLARSLAEALECLLRNQYDVILLDLLLPDSEGLHTLDRICKAAPESAVLVITSTEDEAFGAEIIRAGAQDYRIKPERRKGEIARSIVHAIERKRLQVELQHERNMLEQRVGERTAELETTSGQLQSLFDNLADMFFSVDPVSRQFLQLSPAVERIHGRPRQDFLDDPELWKKCLHPDDVPLAEANERASAEGQPTRSEYRMFRPDGELRWIEARVNPAMDASGAVVRIDGVVSDITARKQAERELRDSESRHRLILESAMDAMIVMDSNGRITDWNPKAETIFGWKREEILGRKASETIIPPQYREAHLHGLQHFLKTGEGAVLNRLIEITALDRNGREFPIELTVSPLHLGESYAFSAFLRDITDRKQAEENLRESNLQLQAALEQVRSSQAKILEQERLRALGTMASGIAHDFNNALSPILGFTELLLDNPEVKLQNRERVIRFLKMMNTAGRDAANIVGRLREFYRARESTEVFLPVNLNQIVDQAIALTRPKWKDQAQAAGASVEVESDPGKIPLIAGNESDLREVLTNLIFNAVDAMPEGGAITIRTHVRDDTATGGHGDTATPPIAPSPHRLVVLSVEDTGVGMTEEVRKQCLEPFFTTKGEKGTGLGLSMVYGIIRRHEGTLDIASEVGRGTTFSITLPEYQPVRAATEEKPQAEPTQFLRVLVVDDEEMVRETISAYLTDDGHEVEVATNGTEALQKLHAGLFDLVITDRAMPEMGGDQLARTIKQTAPGKPVLMLTGFGDLMQAVGEKPEGVDEVIGKPPTLQAVRMAVSKVMARK